MCSQVPACAPSEQLDTDIQRTMGYNPETSLPLLGGLWNQIELTVALVVSVTAWPKYQDVQAEEALGGKEKEKTLQKEGVLCAKTPGNKEAEQVRGSE